ncbi:MAG: ATP-binding cassette domain-containing protein [Candidatus Limiplasma sp.]|nr:ATP-binding cassette domain-containing protein [Candidatus Limiplasma sp.]
MGEYVLEMRNITKCFPGVMALDNVSFRVKRGEVHCLVGENGAGKSTLIKVLSGVYPYGSYEGDIVIHDAVQKFHTISDSEKMGIAIIYQELALIPELSIYENIFFGNEIMRGRSIDWNETIVRAKALMDRVGLKADPSTPVKMLGIGKQQLVEIAKALSKNAEILIFDEPTASLNESDSQNLLSLIRELRCSGVTCIMISHKLKEIISIADTITVLRDGKSICSMDVALHHPCEGDIIHNMVGRELADIYPKRKGVHIGDVCFEIRNWTAVDKKKDRVILDDVHLNVRRGEIVGLQGLMGAGRTELALSIFGNTPGYKIVSGEILLEGKPVDTRSPSSVIDAGIAYVTEDRKGNGLVLMQSIRYNITLANLSALCPGLAIEQNKEIQIADEFKQAINIKAPSVEQKLSNLSGGNQQKVQLAKWMYLKPKLLILDEPTRGIDVGAKHEIYTLMNTLVEQGMSIIMISSELPEVLGMSDRIYVMSQGKITGEFITSETTEEIIMTHAVQTKEASS